jgi:superfamily II DNA helicase RecQ
LERLFEVSQVKLSCLKASANGFKVKEYLETRAKAAIAKYAYVPVREKPAKTMTGAVTHPVLFARLKEWRRIKSGILNLPAYMILQQKTMFELSNRLPESHSELKSITGIGKKKITQFGIELLEIIAAYRKAK